MENGKSPPEVIRSQLFLFAKKQMNEIPKYIISKMRLHLAETDDQRLRWLSEINELYRKGWNTSDMIRYREAKEDERRLVEKRMVIEDLIVQYDPGTAGDAAEEAWADLLRRLLPGYKIVVKGFVTGVGPRPSPQIDILVVHPKCPPEVCDIKAIPIEVVMAAFECKLNLRLSDLRKAVTTSHLLKQAHYERIGDPIAGIPVLYGILGLGSAIENKFKYPYEAVLDALKKHSLDSGNTLDMLDLIVVPQEFCIAANPTIYCPDLELYPMDMWFHRNYYVLGDPLDESPSHNALGLFKHKLFSYLEKSDEQLSRIRPLFDLFMRYQHREETLSERSLLELVPRHCIERIARRGYPKGSTVFNFFI